MGVVIYGGMLWVMGSHGATDFVLELIGHLFFGRILAGAAIVLRTRPSTRPSPTTLPPKSWSRS